MRVVDRLYRLVLSGMFGLAGVLMVVMMISIVVDVVLRGLGGQSYAHIFTFNEYFLFVIAFLGAPLLVREKGHVYVEALLMQFPAHWRRRIATLTLVLCIATCAGTPGMLPASRCRTINGTNLMSVPWTCRAGC